LLIRTECKDKELEFQVVGKRQVVGQFNGGTITSDGGALLLRELEARRGIIKEFAACFRDYRKQDQIEHTVEQLLAQRIYGLALGYEDLNDHEQLRRDPLLAVIVGKSDPTGEQRRRAQDRGAALAGKSTLNRLELRSDNAEQDGAYKKIAVDAQSVDRCFVNIFLQAYAQPPKRIILDLDATDDPLHGAQEGRFFHGYYGHYCYLPLYIFCGDFLLCARLRQSNIDGSAGALDEVKRIVAQIRAQWPATEIWLRADSGFTREEIMVWCESNGVEYIFGLAQNARLREEIARQMEQSRLGYEITGRAYRVFADFYYQTLHSWSRRRRVIGKAEHLEKGSNPRFIVTSLNWGEAEARQLYEKIYCARGEMENRIKEQQLELFADRTSAATMKANQLRLWFSSIAYVMMNEVRRIGLAQTEYEQAQCSTIRNKLLKIGAQIKISVRRITVALATSYPYQDLFRLVYHRLTQLSPLRC
jgi:hypothetical protein